MLFPDLFRSCKLHQPSSFWEENPVFNRQESVCKRLCTNALAKSSLYEFQLRRSCLWTKPNIYCLPVPAALCFCVQKQVGGSLWTFPQLNKRAHIPLFYSCHEAPTVILSNTGRIYTDIRMKANENACSLSCSWTPFSGLLLEAVWSIYFGWFVRERVLLCLSCIWIPGCMIYRKRLSKLVKVKLAPLTRTWTQCWDLKQAMNMLRRSFRKYPEVD